MPQAGVVLKLPKGTAAPQGYTYVRSLRTKNVYKKNTAAPVPQADIDALIAGFAGMGIQGAQVQGVDDLVAALGNLQVGEGRTRRRRRGNRKSRRNNRKSRRRA